MERARDGEDGLLEEGGRGGAESKRRALHYQNENAEWERGQPSHNVKIILRPTLP